ncbi:MAG: 5'/3'-nucleotidase SurE [Roseburia sp.]|nr:5'/3'-nucleotidase SurE [Roseburia sp.]
MRILFTNDDGYDSQGLYAVADLFKTDHEITVAAPVTQRSGFSHSLTLKPYTGSCEKIDGRDYPVFAVGGTPADCVKVACRYLDVRPDLVISGINFGQNLGSDILYSGTVSASAEAALMGYRTIALSLDVKKSACNVDFSRAAKLFFKNFDRFYALSGICDIININIPYGNIKGFKTVRMNTQETWKPLYDLSDNGELLPAGGRDYTGLYTDTDEFYCKDGYVTVSPLTIDRTDHAALDKMKGEKFEL